MCSGFSCKIVCFTFYILFHLKALRWWGVTRFAQQQIHTACNKFSVAIQLIVVLWNKVIWLAIVQAKLWHGSETWVLSQCTPKWLKSFHNWCAHDLHMAQFIDLQMALWSTQYWIFVDCHIAWHKKRLLNWYAKPESPLYSFCENSTIIGSGAHCQMWWT
jgi:hypothetical protein